MYWICRLLHLQRYIAKYVYGSMLNERCIAFPAVYCHLFASKGVFWAIWKDFSWVRRLLFLLIEGPSISHCCSCFLKHYLSSSQEIREMIHGADQKNSSPECRVPCEFSGLKPGAVSQLPTYCQFFQYCQIRLAIAGVRVTSWRPCW